MREGNPWLDYTYEKIIFNNNKIMQKISLKRAASLWMAERDEDLEMGTKEYDHLIAMLLSHSEC